MANSLSMLLLVFTVVFFMSHTIFSQEYDWYPHPEDVTIPPIPDYIEPPYEANPPSLEYKLKQNSYYTDKEFAFLQGCLEKMNSNCGSKISLDMKDTTTTPLTIECCIDLLKIGRDCQLVVADLSAAINPYANDMTNAVAKSKNTWKDCVRRVESYIGAPQQSQEFDRYSQEVPEDVNISPTPDIDFEVEVPEESPSEADSPATTEYKMDLGGYYSGEEISFLQGCLKKLESDCGKKILKDMEDETTEQLTNECCLDLLKTGRDCQVIVAELVAVPLAYDTRSSKAVAKSKQTWKDCVCRVGSQIGAPISLE